MVSQPNAGNGSTPGTKNVAGLAFIAGLLLAAVIVVGWVLLHRPEVGGQLASSKPLVVGYQTSPAMALIMVADAHHDLPGIKLQEFQAGKLALQAFLGGSLDVAVAGDVPVGLALLQGQQLVVFAEVIEDSKDEIRMVVHQEGRCDPTGAQAYFMQGREPKKIATSFGGGPQYFVVRFLSSYGVPFERVKILSYSPAEMPAAVESGSVDGAAVFDPAAASIERSLGVQGCTFRDPGSYRQHYLAVTRPALMRKGQVDPRITEFVAALRRAQQFILANPDAAKSIVQSKTQIDQPTLEALWKKMQFGVTLDMTLPRLWMQQADFYARQSDAGVVDHHPKYESAISDAALH